MASKTAYVTFLLGALMMAGPIRGQSEDGQPSREFDTFWMVFLMRGDDPPELDEAASADLQRQHLGHLSKVYREGYSLVAGPLEVPPEDPLRGFVLYRGNLERERVVELATADPAVQAGRLKVEVRKWWTPAGKMSFTPAPSHSDGP